MPHSSAPTPASAPLSKLITLLKHRYFSALLLVGLMLASGFGHLNYQQISREQLQQELRNHYGQALADTAAEQSVVAMLSNDLLSLQALLEDIAKNPRVVGATLHDVDNQLLVQGGLRPDQFPDNKHLRSHYSAPISLDNALAGSLTVVLAPPVIASALSYAPPIIITLLLAILGAGVLLWRQRIIAKLTQVNRQASKPLPIVTSDLKATSNIKVTSDIKASTNTQLTSRDRLTSGNNAQADTQTSNTAGKASTRSSEAYKAEPVSDLPQLQEEREHVQLQLNCLGLKKLNQTLARDRYKALVFTLESRIDCALKLYGGTLVAIDSDNFTLDFSADTQEAASFNALCASFLLIDLYREETGLKPLLRAHLEALDNDQLLNRLERERNYELCDWQVQVQAELVSPNLQSKVHFSDTQAKAISEPYSRLLQQQREHIKQLD